MMTMKNWRLEMARRHGVCERTVCTWLASGAVRPKVKRVNRRVVFVLSPMLDPVLK